MIFITEEYFRMTKYISLCLFAAIIFLFESCAVCSSCYEQDSYKSSPYIDTEIDTLDSLTILSEVRCLEDNIKHIFKGKQIIYNIKIKEDYSRSLRHSNDTIVLNSFVITDKQGDTLRTTAIRRLFENSGDTINSLPYCFVFDDSTAYESLTMIMVSKGYWKMPKTIFDSYDLQVNDYILRRENVEYEWLLDSGIRNIFDLPIVLIGGVVMYFLPDKWVN